MSFNIQKIYAVSISGHFYIDLQKHPKATQSGLAKAIKDFVEKQRPSTNAVNENQVRFTNHWFRFKVNRAHNFLRAFKSGEIQVQQEGKKLAISYSGKLQRGVFIALMYTAVAMIACAFRWQALFWLPLVVFVITFLSQIFLTHSVFPKVLYQAAKQYLADRHVETS